MTVIEILKKVEEINTESKYWFVRTDNGDLFERFFENNYIAIGWDYITVYELLNRKEDVVKAKIAKTEQIDLTTFRGKSKVTAIYNKLKAFLNLRLGDVVIIPSRNSNRLAFGRVADETVFTEINAKEFVKRRKVEWQETKYVDNLNPIFFQVKSNQHTISSIDRFAPHIDRVIGNLFKKGDNTHYVLNIEKEDDISFDSVKALIDSIKILVNNINNDFEFGEKLEDFYVKINLQSKGAFELIKKGKSLAVLAYLMHLISCNGLDKEKDRKLQHFIEANKKVLDSTAKTIDELKMNVNEITKPFKNGN